MKHVKLFEQFLNESVTTEQRDKIFADADKWAKSLNLDYKIEGSTYGGGGWMHVYSEMGVWSLELYAAAKKAGQNSNYQETYEKDRNNLKWYIKFPGSTNSYNYRSRPGNLCFTQMKRSVFKALIEKFNEVYKNLEPVRDFLTLMNIEDTKMYRFNGKNLKDLGVSYKITNDGDIDYKLDRYGTEVFRYECRYKKDNKFERENFDPFKGEIFYYTALALNDKLENSDKITEILELIKDKPVDQVWKIIEKGDWKDLEHQFRGKLTGKKFGV